MEPEEKFNKITKSLTPNKFSRPSLKIKEVKGLVIHWVANTNSSAEANRRYFENRKNGKNNYGSAHYIIDLNGDIIQCIPDNEVAYHTGAKKYKPEVKEKLFNYPNFYTLGIECTHIKDSGEMSLNTYNSLIQLTLELCKQYKIDPLTFLFRHFDITGKLCHKWFIDNPAEWKQFKNKINELLHNNKIKPQQEEQKEIESLNSCSETSKIKKQEKKDNILSIISNRLMNLLKRFRRTRK